MTLILVASALIGVHLRFLQLLKSLDIGIVPTCCTCLARVSDILSVFKITYIHGSLSVFVCSCGEYKLKVRIVRDCQEISW